ncbi:TniQ family protein [Ensifer sesbaniae]|uniref:TniQ family protein n=1 Tax=Ensifer sesbaniae TaxID=1214071 RepID=UPI002000EA21|nr:TniQ family protein [Ensifer sesbaniae]
MTLRVTLEYHPDETRKSLLSRLTRANSYRSLRAFLSLNGTSALPFERGEPKAIKRLSDWSGVPVERLSAYDITSSGAGSTWKLGPALMSKDMRIGGNHRYCPKCLAADLQRGSGRPQTRPYVRAAWMTRAVEACVEHGCIIVEAAADQNAQGDFARYVADNFERLREEAVTVPSAASMEVARYVGNRIQGKASNDFLDQFEAYVAVDLCRNIGHFAIQHGVADSGATLLGELSAVDHGFKIACQGPERIEAMIAEAIAREHPLGIEMQGFFGKLRRWLLRNQAKDEFAGIIELFQGIAERNLPIGSDETFILPTRQRHLHSVRSASIEYGMFEDRVYQLAVEARLTEPTDLSSGRIYLDAQKTHHVLSSALDTVTTPEIASDLGIHIDRVRQILDANLLARVEAAQDGTRIYTRVRRSDFEAFKKRLDAPMATSSEMEALVPVGRATQILFCTIVDIIELVFNGQLAGLRRLSHDGTISGLGVSLAELQPLVEDRQKSATNLTLPIFDPADPACGLMNTAQARQKLATATGTVTELLNLKFLEQVKGFNPKTRRAHDYICSKSVESFMENYISLAHLAERKGMFGVTVRDKLADKGVKSLFEPTGRNSRYYLKRDVLDLDF